MCQDPQNHLAPLRPVLARSERGVEQALDHAVDGFSLPALSVLPFVKSRRHHASPPSLGQFAGRPPTGRWNNRPHAVFRTSENVRGLTVKTSVRKDGTNSRTTRDLRDLADGRLKVPGGN